MEENKISIIEKVKRFADLAEGLREPLDDNELAELSKDIGQHGIRVYEYMKLVEADAEKLKDDAIKLAEAAKQQKNKAKSLKGYLADAMVLNGFEKLKAGRFSMAVQKRKKVIEKRPATEADFLANPNLVNPHFLWSRDPQAVDKISHGDLVSTEYDWNLAEIKKLDEVEKQKYSETKTTLVLTTKIAKEN